MAWDVLKEQLNSKKHRSAWSSVHEKLMVKFIDISIELQKYVGQSDRPIVSQRAESALTSTARRHCSSLLLFPLLV
jgi:hypothetical protein